MNTNIKRITASNAAIIMGLVSLTFPASSVLGQSCTLSDTSEIIENSHKLLHDFDDPVPGCNSNFGPSGIVYHPGLDRLIVISDKGGQFATMKTDGSDVECRDIRDKDGDPLAGVDHEGVTFADAGDGFIYVGLESGPEDGIAIIRQVELSSAKVMATWRIDFPGGIVENDGLESLTFVRDGSHREGGTFYVGDQTANKVVGKCEVPIRSGGDADALYGCSIEIDPQFQEVSGLDYVADAKIDGHVGVVFLSSDGDNKITAFSPEGTSLDWTREFPETSEHGQEGHAIKGCELFISSDANADSQKIHRYQFSP